MTSRSVLEKRFECAVEVIQSLPKKGSFQPSYEIMGRFYSLYKQAKCGPCTGPRPAFWDAYARGKFDAWSSLGDMSREEAMEKYVETLKQIVEVMPQTDAVEDFTRSIGKFYEIVDLENSASENLAVVNGNEVEDDAETEESNDEHFSDTIDFQPVEADESDDDMPIVLKAIEDIRKDVASMSSRLQSIEKSILALNSKSKSASVTAVLLQFFKNQNFIRLIFFLLPIIAGFFAARRFFLPR